MMKSTPKYDPVVSDDQSHSARSSTEVEESLIGEKRWLNGEDYHQSPPPKRRTIWTVLSSYRWIIDTVLLLVIVGLLVQNQRHWESSQTSAQEVGGDITGVRPAFSTQVTKFQINQTYAPYNTSEFFKPEVLQAWNELMPRGMGFTVVNHTHKYHDLPTPIIWPGQTVFTTSLTHQLHCLFAVVQTYSGLTSGHPIPDDHHWHMIHCFDYMRQAIMCSADMALEGLETTFPDHNGGSDGWDSKHVCRDYKQVYNYLESVRAYDDQEIF